MNESASDTVRQRTDTGPLPHLIEVPDTCTYRAGCPNDAAPGNIEGLCELHATFGESPPPEPDGFSCA